ncbi:hypothetical protein Hanom_Chr02g00161641 [Helianthus anomalus]
MLNFGIWDSVSQISEIKNELLTLKNIRSTHDFKSNHEHPYLLTKMYMQFPM